MIDLADRFTSKRPAKRLGVKNESAKKVAGGTDTCIFNSANDASLSLDLYL
jgi:hypothetical protein